MDNFSRPNIRSFLLALFAGLALLLSANIAGAKVYKWIDADGVTQYTQHPPPDDIEAQEIKTLPYNAGTAKAAQAAAREALEKRVDGLNERRSDKKLAETEGQHAVEQRKKLDEFCTTAKARLADYESNRKIVQKQADGSYLLVTEEQRLEKTAQLEAQIKEHCNN